MNSSPTPREGPALLPARRTCPPGSPTRSPADTSTPVRCACTLSPAATARRCCWSTAGPQTWYAWRMLMPILARDFQVIAVAQRGIGLSDKPLRRVTTPSPLRTTTVALMAECVHQRDQIVGEGAGVVPVRRACRTARYRAGRPR